MHKVLLVNDCKFENFIMRDMLINLGCEVIISNDLNLEDFNNKVIDAFLHTPVTKEKLEQVLKENSHILNKHKNNMKPSFCIYCGEKLDDIEKLAKFCKYCGEKT